MKFVVVGFGFVGKAVYSVLNEKHDTKIIDPIHVNSFPAGENIIGAGAETVQEIRGVDGFILCVPTPEGSNGRCDDSLVLDYIEQIREHHKNAHILIKSTTSVESLQMLDHYSNKCDKLTFSPEFLRGSVGTDPSQEFRDATFMIYGGKGGRWWHEVFSQVMNYTDVRFLDLVSAGFLKYAENSFLATKVMFFNELRNLYDHAVDVNYDAMIEALALDKRIGISHTQVPGPDGKYGFGGHCLPKDTSEFSLWAQEQGAPLKLLEQSRHLNFTKYRNKD